jgi:hypothetical protein
MTKEPRYTFIAHPYPTHVQGCVRNTVTMDILDADASRMELVEQFERFLVAAGYFISDNETLQFIDEEEHQEVNYSTDRWTH